MKKLPLLFLKTFLYSLLSLFVFFILLASLFHTRKGQEYFLSYLHTWSQKNQINISVERAEILSPFSFRLDEVRLQATSSRRVAIDQLTIRISPLPLLVKKLVLSQVVAKNVTLMESSPQNNEVLPMFRIHLKSHWVEPPFTLEITSFRIEDLHLEKEWRIKGKGKIEKNGKEIVFALLASPKDEEASSLQLVGSITKKTRSFRSRLILDTPSLSSLFSFPYDASVFLQIDGKGKVDNFYRMLSSERGAATNLAAEGFLKGKIIGLPSFEKDPFKNLRIDKGRIASSFQISESRNCKLFDLYYVNDKTALKGSCFFDVPSGLQKCDFFLKTKNLSIQEPRLPALVLEKGAGELHYNAQLGPFFNISFFSPQIRIGPHTIEDVALNSQLKHNENGSLESTFFFKKEKAKATAEFQWEDEAVFSLRSSSLTLPSAHASASLKRTPLGLLTGKIEVRFEKMNLFYALFPDLPFLAESGDLILRLYSTPDAKGKQEAQIQADLTNFHYQSLSGKKAYLSFDSEEPFSEMKGLLKFLLQDASFRDIGIKGLFLETSNRQENWPYELFLSGMWKEPFQIRSSGFWKFSPNDLLVTIDALSGHLLGQPLAAPEPIQWEWSPDQFSMKNFRIQLASSSLEGSIFLSHQEAEIQLHSTHFPIDFLSLNPLNLRVRGHASMDATLRQKEQKLNGAIHLTLEKLDVYSLSEKTPLHAMGAVEIQVADNNYSVKSRLAMNQKEIMEFSAFGQALLTPLPFHFSLDKQSPIFSRLTYDGGIEELLDFFDLGTHRIKGHLQCRMELSKTLLHPELNGFCQFEKGTYENYYTGSYLKNLQAKVKAEKDLLQIESLTASDLHNGSLAAKGLLLLDPKKHFPFLVIAALDKLSSIQTDLIDATTSGKLQIKGTSLSAKAVGRIEVNKASLSVPDRIPPFSPDFTITYRNHPFSKKQEEIAAAYTPYPLYLDLDLFAKDHIMISGKGLNAECMGSLKIEGSYTDLIAKGQLNLLHGDYSFSGRVFTLTQGSLIFPGIIGALPVLSLAGQVQQKGVVISAHLKGPLNAPSLTFESLPPLPLSSIMSLLIFGQDISEISGIQAIQLATTIASLSNGSNLLEAARKNLGIDRFTIISSPAAAPDESEKIAVQVGKYITKDVLVSLTQGTQEDSSNISVEVDLKHGFIFQAETMQEEEQSKFTLKWNINY